MAIAAAAWLLPVVCWPCIALFTPFQVGYVLCTVLVLLLCVSGEMKEDGYVHLCFFHGVIAFCLIFPLVESKGTNVTIQGVVFNGLMAWIYFQLGCDPPRSPRIF